MVARLWINSQPIALSVLTYQDDAVPYQDHNIRFRWNETGPRRLPNVVHVPPSTTFSDRSDDHDDDLQLDIMVPAYERNERLQLFARNLGKAIFEYHQQSVNAGVGERRITKFRLLVTRYTEQEKARSPAFQRVLAKLTGLELPDIVMVHSSDNAKFTRASALKLLHDAACHLESCLVSRLDVDIEVRPEFFDHAIQTVVLRHQPPNDSQNAEWQNPSKSNTINNSTPTVYFPIVWSAYNPKSVELVEADFRQKGQDLPAYSEHRGHWRPYGKGMYVLSGPDALLLNYDAFTHQGWGGEDVDFYKRCVALPRRILRRTETGLIHTWHNKNCTMGVEVHTEDKRNKCLDSNRRERGSPYGIKLLTEYERNRKTSTKPT